MVESIINSILRDWVTDPIFLLAVSAVPLVLVAFRFKSRNKRGQYLARFFAVGFLAVLLLCSAPALVNPLVNTLEQQFPIDTRCNSATPIVALGAGVNRRASEADQTEYLYGPTHVRIARASALAIANPQAPVIVSGAGLHQVTEAAMMRAYLLQRGVSESRIFSDTTSSNTKENAENVAVLVAKHGFSKQLRLVTSALHMPRAVGVFQAAGIDACATPVDYLGLPNVPWYALAPQTTALVKFDKYLHERIGSWYYQRKQWFN